ncbi:MAG: hypothetical protein HY700_21785 [Gemmatimonadetes bacterium]|nr:hypothetical protein [Gemmatimonadota bacterium]
MSARRYLIPLALALFAAACSDSVGVRSAGEPRLTTPHLLRWAGNTPPRFSAIGSLRGGVIPPPGDGVMLAGPQELSLDQNTASFWAVRGEQRSVQINYQSSNGDSSSSFLRLTIADPVYVPGHGDLVPGDSVLITVTVDPQAIKVSLEPTGLLFGDPAELQISYGGAHGDLNGDGVVDGFDAVIEQLLLGMWYREGAESAWAKIPAMQSVADKTLTSALQHFSEYAVFSEYADLSDYAVSW